MGDKGASASKQAAMAQKTWQMTNGIVDLDSAYVYNEDEQKNIRIAKPWEKDAHYFKEVKISAVALLKMTMHARRGGNIEIMGLMQGRVDAHSLIVTDSFALPVEGTETRVNAQADANEYSVMYADLCESVGRKDKVIGWYHSHPGYGCWLSGIDVSTQSLNQQFQEPFVAIVIDPVKTLSAGKVEIGAFRTYPKGYKPPEDSRSEYQNIPLEKIEDFGVHCKAYYSLDVSFFKSSLDSAVLSSLWSTYWATTLASSPLATNADYVNQQLNDLSRKLGQVHKAIARTSDRSNEVQDKMDKAVLDANFVGCELLNNLVVQNLKRALFGRGCCCKEKGQRMETDDVPLQTTEDEPMA